MSYASNRTNIEALFFTEFAAAEPNVDIAVENDGYKPGNNSWVRISVRHADTKFKSLGNTNERFMGAVYVQIFTEIGKGTAEDDRIADAIADIFRGRIVNGIHYVNSNKTPAVIGEGWLQSTVVTEFWTDENY